MEIFKIIIENLTKLFRWWIIVHPWESGLRVRFGKKIKQLKSGIHFRIPYLDSCYVQTIRLRVIGLCPQTTSTKDGQTITVICNVGYQISDLQKMYNTLYHPESTIGNIFQGKVAQFISGNNLVDVTPNSIKEYVERDLNGDEFGITYKYIQVTGFAIVKTFRLIQDSHWQETNTKMDVTV